MESLLHRKNRVRDRQNHASTDWNGFNAERLRQYQLNVNKNARTKLLRQVNYREHIGFCQLNCVVHTVHTPMRNVLCNWTVNDEPKKWCRTTNRKRVVLCSGYYVGLGHRSNVGFLCGSYFKQRIFFFVEFFVSSLPIRPIYNSVILLLLP